MKTCTNCGARIKGRNNFCPNCGTKCDNSQWPVNQSSDYIPESQAAGSHPMKWHKFLMVAMIISAILTIAGGLFVLVDLIYLATVPNTSIFYSSHPGMKGCYIVLCVAWIVLGVFQIDVRNRLNKFRKDGPKLLRYLYIASIAAILIYCTLASIITGKVMFGMTEMISLAITAALMIINCVYYSKRKDLFIN